MYDRTHPHPLFEWATSLMMLTMPLCIVATPKTIEAGAFRFLLQLLPGPYMVAAFLLAAGCFRMGALIANGRWRYGDIARTAGAWAGVFMWGQMAYALIMLTWQTGTLSIGIPVWLILAAGEVVAARRIVRERVTIGARRHADGTA